MGKAGFRAEVRPTAAVFNMRLSNTVDQTDSRNTLANKTDSMSGADILCFRCAYRSPLTHYLCCSVLLGWSATTLSG
jgi:hypothetical protein